MQGEEGGATILGCCAIAVLVVVTAALLHVGSAVAARHRTQSAADLAALAAAVALDRGTVAACDSAATIAERMHTAIESCTVEDWDVIVTVTAPVYLSSLGVRDARAVARAGPAE